MSGGTGVQSVEVIETIRTMASKVRVVVRFKNDPARAHAFCIKAFLGEDAAVGGATTIREAGFYTELAPRISMRVPACVGVVINHEERRGVLIMRDLISDGARFCSALEPFTPDLAAQSLEQIARLHVASTLLEQATWVPCRIQELAKTRSFTPEGVQTLLDDPRGNGLPARTRDAALLFAGMRVLADRNAHRPQTLLHGDCHAGNIYLTPDGPGFTDWQLIQRGDWAFDVAYHIAAILPVNVAEREERALLDHYLAMLRSLGGEPPGREDAWDEYRRAQIYGYFHWAITRRVEPGIIRIFIERLGAGVTRHETYRLLGL